MFAVIKNNFPQFHYARSLFDEATENFDNKKKLIIIFLVHQQNMKRKHERIKVFIMQTVCTGYVM
jgi:hypothetical protein